MSATVNQTAAAFGAGRFAIGGRRGPVDRSEVLRLSAQGIGVQNIANMLAVSMEDVRRILEPVDQPAPATEAPVQITALDARASRVATLKAMWKAGATRRAIAEELGIDIYSLDRMRARIGLKTRARVFRPVGYREEDQ